MWLIPLLLIGALTIAAVSRSPREAPLPPRQLPPPPGPISVLGEFARIGQTPPPTVILCAIAEAETIGRSDLASDIIRVFVAPVVYRHELANAKRAQSTLYTPGPMPGSVREVPAPPGPSTQLWPPEANYPGFDPRFGAMERARRGEVPQPRAYERGSCALSLASRAPREEVFRVPAATLVPHGTTRHATDEEIRAMLNADPRSFIEMATRGAPVIEVPVDAVFIETAPHGAPAIEVPVEAVQRAAQALQLIQPPTQPQPTGFPPEAVAQMQEAAGLHEAADQTRALAPGSPIADVSDGAWREFVMRLERESPQFSSSRHVGQYRQRRERLAELGVDLNAIQGSAQAQRGALDIDLTDAHHHASASGLIAEHLGRPIALPGQEAAQPLSLSGLLGVIQCAGLEGAVGWLEQPSDRKRYPHTTQAFARTNGVF